MSMLFHKLKFTGLLSFGPAGIDLPMEPLNVLIGPNGSGKSNFLEAISLFQAAPRGISEPISRMGGVREWLWKGSEAPHLIALEVTVDYPLIGVLRHSLTLTSRDGYVAITDERVEPSVPSESAEGMIYCRGADVVSLEIEDPRPPPMLSGRLWINDRPGVFEFPNDYLREQSIVSITIPNQPGLWHLKEQYDRIRLYRNWSFGPDANSRQPCSAHARSDFLDECGENLPLVLSQLHGMHKKSYLAALSKLFDGIVDIQCPVTGGTVALFLEEAGNRSIPATRLSDGTLRYLCLLAILLHPEPPPLICIEEPELGLHPDLLPTLSDLMREASERTQLIVTTHSDILVDTLTDQPESVVVCEKHNGQTEMRRLDRSDLAKWLNDYRLGDLWTSGELGGNRW